jgi:hypothetical protein
MTNGTGPTGHQVTSQTARQSFLVGLRAAPQGSAGPAPAVTTTSHLAVLAAVFDADPQTNLVRVSGQPEQPSRLEVEMDPEYAARLRERFARVGLPIIIEPNAAVSPLAGPP